MKKYLLILLTLITGAFSIPVITGSNDPMVIAYVFHVRDSSLLEKQVSKLTHINYAFANARDGEIVLESHRDSSALRYLNSLKKINPDLKILLSVGGWSWSKFFSDIALTDSSRLEFAESAVQHIREFGLDGIDIDWEYPGQVGNNNVYREEDKENFTLMLKALRDKMDAYRPGLLLTIAAGTNESWIQNTEMDRVQKYLDWVNLMTYDFNGGWNNYTGHLTNLRTSKYDTRGGNSAERAVESFEKAGVPREKMVIGAAFYGRWWSGVNPENNGLYQDAGGTAGSIRYHKIVDSLLYNDKFELLVDNSALSPYMWNSSDSVFLTFEDAASLRQKVAFIKEEDLAGIMFWEFNGDNGELLDTIDGAVRGE